MYCTAFMAQSADLLSAANSKKKRFGNIRNDIMVNITSRIIFNRLKIKIFETLIPCLNF